MVLNFLHGSLQIKIKNGIYNSDRVTISTNFDSSEMWRKQPHLCNNKKAVAVETL